MHDAATVAFAVILTGAGHVTVNPVAGLVTGVRVTVPAKLKVLVSVTIVDAPEVPELKLTGLVALILKSPMCDTKLAV